MKRAKWVQGKRFLIPLFLLSTFAFAVTYRVDSANGPDTLATEVKEAFDAWVALSNKVEVSETQENPEGVFQYGDSARFGEDTLSLTVQRQTNTRSISYLISPNAENRKRILLHETGIAIGLTPQIPGTPSTATPETPAPETPAPTPEQAAPPEGAPPAPTPGTPTESGTSETSSETSEPQTEGSTEETTSEETTSEETESEESAAGDETSSDDSTTSEDSSSEDGTANVEQSNSESGTDESTTDESTTEQNAQGEGTQGQAAPQPTFETTPESSEESAGEAPAETTPPAVTANSAMNPSISPDDSTELGEVERQLLEQLQLFVSEDINRDGAVNFYDLLALSQAFGRSGVNDPADINKDGLINQADVNELRQSYTFSDPSETAPGSSTAAPEGEPSENEPSGTDSTNTAPPPESATPTTTPPAEDTSDDSSN